MAGQRAHAEWTEPGTLIVQCPSCKRSHVFKQISFDKMILDGVWDDDFDMVTADDGSKYLWPQFVCRADSCSFGATIRI